MGRWAAAKYMAGSDWVQSFGSGGRLSAIADTGRSAFAGTAERSTLRLDPRDTPGRSRLNIQRLRTPSGCFHHVSTGATDPERIIPLRGGRTSGIDSGSQTRVFQAARARPSPKRDPKALRGQSRTVTPCQAAIPKRQRCRAWQGRGSKPVLSYWTKSCPTSHNERSPKRLLEP